MKARSINIQILVSLRTSHNNKKENQNQLTKYNTYNQLNK